MPYKSKIMISYLVCWRKDPKIFYSNQEIEGLITNTDNDEEIIDKLEEYLLEKHFYENLDKSEGELPEIEFTAPPRILETCEIIVDLEEINMSPDEKDKDHYH